MRLTMFLAALSCFLCILRASRAEGTWSGSLVDSKCYATEEANHDPTDTDTAVDRDRDLEISVCTPTKKTTSFGVVKFDGTWFKLDSNGNAKAAQLLMSAGKQRSFHVDVAGDMNKNVVQVSSIAIAK